MQPSASPQTLDTSRPVLILGGKENSLAIARNLGRHGVTIRISGPGSCWGMHSRFCRQSFPIPIGGDAPQFWRQLLLSPGSASLHGHVLFACSDAAIEFVADHRQELSRHYILDAADPRLNRIFLDKRRTLDLAAKHGIGAPRYWEVKSD